MGEALLPVVDVSLPDEDRDLLGESAEGLTPAGAPAPPRRALGGRTWADAAAALPVSALCGFLPVVGVPLLLGRRRGLPLGAVGQVPVVAAT